MQYTLYNWSIPKRNRKKVSPLIARQLREVGAKGRDRKKDLKEKHFED